MTMKSVENQSENSLSITSEEFLGMFPEYRKLLSELDEANKKISELKELKYFDTSALLRKLSNYQQILDEEILTKGMAPFQHLDVINKYQVLKNMVLILLDDLLELYQNPSAQEVRAVYFLYMLIRFVESEKRFPRKPEEHALLYSNNFVLPCLESLLANACKESRQIKRDIEKQKESRLRNTVGVGIDNEEDTK